MGVVGALSLALGLAFGLGGRDTAAKIVSKWYCELDSDKLKIATSEISDQSRTREKRN
jgi:hypothetical protein